MLASHEQLTVIIPTCDRPASLQACLNALARQTLPVAKVIVINDGRSSVRDLVGAMHCALRLALLSTPHRGPYVARNAGLAIVQTELVAFLDDDAVPTDGWSDACVSMFQKYHKVSAQLGRIQLGGHHLRSMERAHFLQRLRQKVYNSRDRLYMSSEFKDRLAYSLARSEYSELPGAASHLSGGNSAIRMSAIRSLGSFDERFRTMGDTEMAWRILSNQGIIAYNREMCVHHSHDPSVRRALLRCVRAAPYQRLLESAYPSRPWQQKIARRGGLCGFVNISEPLSSGERLYLLIYRSLAWLALRLAFPESIDPLCMVKKER